jgi:phosphate transport system substrate-binding protein
MNVSIVNVSLKDLNMSSFIKKMSLASVVLCTWLFSSCAVSEKPTIYEGEITIAIDESVYPVVDELVKTYKIHYPKAVIKTKIVPENKGMNMLFKDSLTVVACTRDFNKLEKETLEKAELKVLPARMAIDAVAIVTSSGPQQISISTLKKLFEDGQTPLVFDNGNSSNFNFVTEKLRLDPNQAKSLKNVYGAGSNLEVLDKVKSLPGSIGFIGYNWISDQDNKKTQNLMNGLRLVKLEKGNSGQYFEPSFKHLKARNYDFERFVILHTFKGNWGVENGFIRHACSKIGQLVIEKKGIVPFYIIPKEYLLDTKSSIKDILK